MTPSEATAAKFMALQEMASLRLTAVRIVTEDDGTYSVDPHGRLAALIPVRDRWGEIVDAVAFFHDSPQRWWLRFNDEVPILGARALAMAAWERQPLTLWETPLQWLLKHRSGAVVLDWGVDLRTLFEEIPTINCQSKALSDRLQRNFLEFGPLANELGIANDTAGRHGSNAHRTDQWRSILPPATIRKLVLFAAADAKDQEKAQEAIHKAACLQERLGRTVVIAMAPPGQDFNDVLRAASG